MTAPAERKLSPKHLKYVQGIVEGHSCSEAARRAGYSKTYARQAAYKLSNRPNIAKAIEEAREDVRGKIGITLETLLEKLETALAQATAARQFTAVARLIELQGKAAGLLIERNINVDVQVSVAGALAAARARALPGDDAKVIDAEPAPALEDARARLVEFASVDPAEIFTG